MRIEQKLKTIYETIAPTITRSEEAWKAYLRFSSAVYKHPFDNALLVYAQSPKATMLATFDTWTSAKVGRSINKGEKGIAVCEYNNAGPTVKHLFDVTQTSGKNMPAVWTATDEVKAGLLKRLTQSRGIQSDSLVDCIHQLVANSIADHIDGLVKGLEDDVKNHFLSDMPYHGLVAEWIETIHNSCVYYIAHRCGEDADVTLPTISHFDNIPLVARLGYTITELSKGILLEIERNVKILSSERSAQNDQRINREQGTPNPNQQLGNRERGGTTPRQVRPHGDEPPARNQPPKVFTFEDARRAYDPTASSGHRSGGTSRSDNTAIAGARPNADNGRPTGTDAPLEQAERHSGGTSNPRDGVDTPLGEALAEPETPAESVAERDPTTEPTPTETKIEPQGSFFMPAVDEDSIIKADLLRGSMIQGGKTRIYNFMQTNPTPKELADFLKNEYGWGGHSGFEQDVLYVNYRSEGISFELKDSSVDSGMRKLNLKWNDVARRITDLVTSGEYLPNEQDEQPIAPPAPDPTPALPPPPGTPFWQQYTAITKQHPTAIVFKRLGDFYEVLGDNAKIVSDELNIALTSRDVGLSERMPMSGIPAHTAFDYVNRLVQKGYTVALADALTVKEHKPALNKVASDEKDTPAQMTIFEADQPLRLHQELLNAHHGQLDMQIQAFMGDNRVGILNHSVYEGIPRIENIEVAENFRRQGIGTAMVQHLANEYPGVEIEWGLRTDDGVAFHDAVTYTVENEEYTALTTRMDEINKRLSEYEANFSTDTPTDVAEAWNATQDEKYDIQNRLADLNPTKTFIRPSGESSVVTPSNASINQEATQDATDGSGGVVEPHADTPKIKLLPQAPPAPKKINYRYHEDDNLFTGGAKTKFRNNIEAIRLVKHLENENRLATPAEQKILANYVGWGGLANAFSKKAAGWENEYQELKLILDDDEYAAAMNSTITAFYTEPKIAEHMYKALTNFGFDGGKNRTLVEPALGTGNFFSVLPEALQGTKIHGIELDSITGRIAKQLYQQADIKVQGFETSDFADNSVDVIVGNIPFNNISVYDKRYEEENFLIHDYFIAKSLDLLKPGGMAAVITSKGTMDKMSISAREYFARRADLIGAVRLPNNAFKALSGTEVTADILFFQKLDHERTDDLANLPSWVFTSRTPPQYLQINNYFIENPDMVLGELKRDRSMYGNQDGIACIAPEGQDLYAELDRAIHNMMATFTAQPDPEVTALHIESEDAPDEEKIKADEGMKNYTYVVKGDDIFYNENGYLLKQPFSKVKATRIKGLCEIRGALLDVIAVQSREYEYAELESAQKKLNDVYDAFVQKHGYINDKANRILFNNDDQYPLLRSIEDLNDDKVTYSKAPIFTKATIKSYRQPTHADTAKEALEISLNIKQKVNLPYMAYLYEKSEDEVIAELGDRIFLNPQNYYGNPHEGWETAEEYLSGDVVSKLDYAKLKAADNDLFARNVTALQDVQPAKLLPADIDFRIGSPWIPVEYYRQFMYETFETPFSLRPNDYTGNDRIELEYLEYTDIWRIANKRAHHESIKAQQTYGTKRVNGYEIYEDCLNMQAVTVRDPMKYYDGAGREQTKYVVNPNETMIARSKQQQIKEAFETWLFADKNRAEVLLTLYNERFNRIRPREYDGSHLRFNGLSEEREFRPYQKNVIARIIYHGTCLMAHEVGAGKTASMIAAGMYMKNMGLIKKPIYVVPNHLIEQWANEFMRFFPSANILVTTKADFEKKNRKNFVSKIAMGAHDAIIIGQSQFEKIPVSRERQERLLNQEIANLTRIIDLMKQEKGENWAIKQIVIFQNNLKKRLESLIKEERKDDLLTFEQLGVDYLFVDEAHAYKNCYTYSKLRNVAGIGQSKSQRAADMLMKCQYLQEINNGRGVTFATGTPLSNSMSEMFVMQRFLQPDLLKKTGLHYFDKWAATFGDIVSSLEINPEGSGYRIKNRFSKFHNLPELMKLFRVVADIQTSDMLNLPVPEIDGGKAQVIVTERSPFQKEIMLGFVERAEAIRNRDVDPEEDNFLKLTNEAKLMAIDPRLVYADAPNDPDSKLNTCIRSVHGIWQETADEKLTQVIFCDSGTPKPGQFNVYDEVKSQLIKMGVPTEEIAFVHDAKTDAEREALFEKTRKGKIRVLLGSTAKLGTGTNIQKKLYALHHLDVPWRPSDIIQRDGRGLRFGNDNASIKIFRYVTQDTFDAYLWQIQEQKLRYITQIITSKSVSRSCEDVDETVLNAAEIKAIATSNPLLAEKMTVDNEVARLKLLKGNWINEHILLKRNIETLYPDSIAQSESRIKGINHDMAVLAQHKGGDFIIEIDGKKYNDRTAAGEVLLTVINAKCEPGEGQVCIGHYRGLDLYAIRKNIIEADLRLVGQARYATAASDSPIGCITRIENIIERIPGYLTETEANLENTRHQLEAAKQAVDNPFEYEEKLATQLTRQSEINTTLEFKELSKQQDAFLNDNGSEDKSNENETEEVMENEGEVAA